MGNNVLNYLKIKGTLLDAILLLLLCATGAAYGQSANAEKLIRVDLGQYTPGTIPGGIGEPVQESRNIADEWEAAHPGCKIKYQLMINTGTTEGEWLKTQLIGKIAPEIVSMNT